MTRRQFFLAQSFGAAIVSIGVVCLIVTAFAFLTPAPADEKIEQDRFLEVATTNVTLETSCTLSRTYTGTIRASRESELSFETTGRLIEVLVDEGALVDKGQVLAVVDGRNLYARLKQFQAQRASAMAVFSELKAGPRKETISAAKAEVSRARAELALEQANLDRNTRLVDNNAIAVSEFDRVKFAVEAKSAALEAAQHQLAELEAGTRKEKIAAQQALIEQLAASIDDIAVDIEDTQLRAPYAGSISHRHADEGLVLQPGQAVLTLVENAQLEVWVGVPVRAAESLSVGDGIEVTVEQRKYAATVASISPSLDLQTRTRRMRAKFVDDVSDAIFPGQIVRLSIKEVVDAAGFWLPTMALSEGARGLWTVYVVSEKGIVERRDVEILHTRGNDVFVRGTIVDHEAVIAQGIHRVAPGQRVVISK